MPPIDVRHPVPADAAAIHRLIRIEGGLDLNSLYCYLLLCTDFSRTSLVASVAGDVIGFVVAYRPPPRPDSLFVWQVGVSRNARGQGLARRLLRDLLALPACDGVQYLEATVTPSNAASRRLFTRLAEELGVPSEMGPGFTEELFCGGDSISGEKPHEAEERWRIGPLAKPA
jgi:L-2,4-diaminobutyric acid acetyltransferase